MTDYKRRIDELADLMREFGLSEASLDAEGLHVAFRRRAHRVASPDGNAEPIEAIESFDSWAFPVPSDPVQVVPPVPKGTPITSPMNGIFYSSPSPSSPPFAKVGDVVSLGQTVGLIEAMKVFNEVPSPVAGTVLEMVAEPGAVVQPGDVLMYIG